MARKAAIEKAKSTLLEGLEKRDWLATSAARQRLTLMLLEAAMSRSAADAILIKSILASAFTKLALKHELPLDQSPQTVAVTLNALAEVADQITRMLPTSNKLPLGAEQRILKSLATSNRGRLSNKDLAGICDLAEETVSRTLSRLSAEKKVLSWKAGRERVNEITAVGRDYLFAPVGNRSPHRLDSDLVAAKLAATKNHMRGQAGIHLDENLWKSFPLPENFRVVHGVESQQNQWQELQPRGAHHDLADLHLATPKLGKIPTQPHNLNTSSDYRNPKAPDVLN